MPAKPLTDEQRQDAERLDAAFKRYQARLKAAGEASSQDDLAPKLGLGQSGLNQYLKGKIPLNGPFLRVFCDLTGENPDKISPAVAAQERKYAAKWLGSTAPTIQPDQIVDLIGRAALNKLPLIPEAKRNVILANLYMSLGLEPSPELLGKDSHPSEEDAPLSAHS